MLFPYVSDGFESIAVTHLPVSPTESIKGILVVGLTGQAITYPFGV
jgi:hypothetical protein